jgi:hypothetical protein
MKKLHKAIVLRAPSVHRKTVTLFDDQLGKIEGILGRTAMLSHGALISYALQKRSTCYYLQDVCLLEMPLEWARDNFLFFHHVLELCDYFVPWDVHCEALFELVYFLYTHPALLRTKEAQKLFLTSFFKRVGIHPEQGNESLEHWLRACVNAHPQVLSFRTAGFLKMLECHEEPA